MRYSCIVKGTFLQRPNRFIAHVEIEGREEICHVKNTGRCQELLIPGAAVILERVKSNTRKTSYDLIAVYKGDRLVNMDSQAPNKAAREWLASGSLGDVTGLRPETAYHKSRFDFAFEIGGKKAFMEVKGVTLEIDGGAYFPDAPTERGVKHIRELIDAAGEGYLAYILFVIQMKDVTHFSPNDMMHPAFGEALRQAHGKGITILAYDCRVAPDTMDIYRPVQVVL